MIKSIKIVITSFLLLMNISTVKAYNNKVSFYTKNKIKNELEYLNLKLGSPIFIKIFKKEAILEVWIRKDDKDNYVLFRAYPICKFSGELGPKLREGDKQSPEGVYKVNLDSLNPNSDYHLSFNLGFPNDYDKFYNRTGSYLMIHGGCYSIGCYAMGDNQIEEIYYLIEESLKSTGHVFIYAFPFHLTEKNLNNYKGNRWFSFWKELQNIYIELEKKNKPIYISIINGRYKLP